MPEHLVIGYIRLVVFGFAALVIVPIEVCFYALRGALRGVFEYIGASETFLDKVADKILGV